MISPLPPLLNEPILEEPDDTPLPETTASTTLSPIIKLKKEWKELRENNDAALANYRKPFSHNPNKQPPSLLSFAVPSGREVATRRRNGSYINRSNRLAYTIRKQNNIIEALREENKLLGKVFDLIDQ